MSAFPLMHETWGGWPWFAPLWILLWIVVIATVIRLLAPARWLVVRAAVRRRPAGRRRSWPTGSRGARSTPPSTGPGWTPSVSRLKPMTRDNSIVVEKLVREFKKGPRAVDGIDLHVAPGEIYGFLGPNGAGKSTTVLMLTTLLPPTAGKALVGGYDVRTEGPKVRSVIGAALQEAALDPLLTGRDHLRLQTMLQAIPRAERKARQNELLDRVGLTEAADRKVGGYSGGMKRRLDLALALVHRPSILFLDEPTTGLDPQSRTALWEEVARLAREDSVTVFLTTQYLEEADVLADRVGIIDHGKIVAEGTPAALKAEIGRASIHVIPRQEDDRPQIQELLGRFGEKLGGERDLAVRLNDGLGMADVIRAMDADGIVAADVELRAPTLDDVFLAKTGRTLEGAATGEDGAAGRMSALPTQVGALAQRSIMRTARQPASAIPPLLFPVALMLLNSGGLHASTELPGFPTDSFLAFALAVPFIQGALFSTMNAGTDLARDIQTGFFSRLSLTPVRGWGAPRRPARRDRRARRAPGGLLHLLRAAARRSLRRRPGGDRPAARLRRARRGRLRRDRRRSRAAHRLGRVDPGALPAPLRLPLHLVDEHAAQPDRGRLVPVPRLDQPDLVSDRVRPEPDHHRLGRARRSRSGSASRSCLRSSRSSSRGRAMGKAARPIVSIWPVASGVAWRTLKNVITTPSLVMPSLMFPLLFFIAFAGGLSQVQNTPGFDYPNGYTAFQFVFVLLQSAAFGGVFTGFGVARDFEGGFARRLMLAAPNRTGIVVGYAWRRCCAGASRRRS